MPFAREWGYDVFNPNEVTPELVADIGLKQGEKIDYAIIKDGAPTILIECKHHGSPKVESSRVVYRDARSYFAIFLDDNNRKWIICRLYLGTDKYIGIINDNKKEVKHTLS